MSKKKKMLSELTGKEQEIVGQLITGKSNAEIGTEMGISLNTVKTHLKHVYAKLEVHNRQELIVAMLT